MITGIFTKQVVTNSLILLPALILGTLAGMAIFKRTDEKLFRKFIVAFLVVMGILTIFSGLKIV